MSGLTVVVPAKDEELHIERCIDSAGDLGPVVVVDGGSTDRTVELARGRGATVVEHHWEGYAAQKNWALDNAAESDWVLFLDADERLTLEGKEEIRSAVARPEVSGYYVPRRLVFLGRELKHAWWYPDYQLRLFRRARGRYEDRRVHEHVIVDGPVENLRTALLHENLKGMSEFIERHNRYSDLEVEELFEPSPVRRKGSFTGNWADRRRALKDRIWFRLPGRPTIRFLWLYLVKRGFLDGREGRLYCRLIATYDLFIDAKRLERKLRGEHERR